jgi:TonB-linked SusC/RagA family outer membrane protein
MKQKSIFFSPCLMRFSTLFILMILLCNFVLGQTKVITGTVTDDQGQALMGANIKVKGTANGAVTDEAGKYSVTAAKNGTLIFSFSGFTPQTVLVNNRSVIDITLVREINNLEEVIVTGYRSQTRGSVLGSVTSVSSSEFSKMPVDNLSNALAGRLSGVTITQSAGTPGMESSIRIRAEGTFNNTSPLYVIDGIVSDKFTFDGLSPNEVNEITVLKDGASAAIYGSRAANGVILVTTKRGHEGKPKLTYSGLYGFQTPTKIPKTFTAFQQASAINNALKYNNTPETDARYYTQDELDYFKTHSWNWIDEMWQNPTTTQHSLDVSGGSKNVRYFLGGSLNSATGSFNNLSYQKYTLRGNLDVSVTKDLKISLDMNTDKRKTNGPSWQVSNWRQEDLYKALLIRSPMVPPYVNGLPVGNWVEWHPGVIVDPSQSGYNKKEWNEVNSTVSINYTAPFLKGLSAKVALNRFNRNIYNKQFQLPYNMTLFNTLGEHNHIVGDTAVGLRPRAADEFLQSRYDKIEQYQFDAQINYKNSFGKHNIDALLVYEQEEDNTVWFNGRRDNFISNAIDQYVAGSPVNPHVDGSESQFARLSYVGLASYNYAQKYLLEASFRYDGSVKFAPAHRWGFFPGASAGWRISNEPFFKSTFINDLKIRASVALVGNDYIDDFQWLQSDEIVDGAIFNEPTNGLEPGTLANPNITWEKSLSYNTGFDSRFWDNRMSLKLDLFYRHTYDILGTRQLIVPSTFGPDLPDENYEQIDTRGFEIELGYNSHGKNSASSFNYYAHGNFGFSTNKVIRLDEAENIRPYKSKVGRPIGGVFGYVADGILRSQKQIDALPAGYTILGKKPQLGMLNYKDLRGVNSDTPDGKITADDQTFIADHSDPTMTFGLSVGATWKSFNLDVLLQGVAGGKIMMPNTGRDIQARAEESSFAYWADSWTPENPNGKYPGYRGTSYRTRADASSFWLQDLSFLRLKNISLSYNLPEHLLSGIGVSNVRVFFTGTNLAMIYSGNKIYDPEMNSITAYPMMKTYSFGINIGL